MEKLTKRQNDIALSGIIMNDKEFYNLLQFKEKAEIEAKIPKDLNQVRLQSSPLMFQFCCWLSLAAQMILCFFLTHPEGL